VQDAGLRKRQPSINLSQGLIGRTGRRKYFWMGDDSQELMQTAQRNAPGLRAFSQRHHASGRDVIKFTRLPMCVHQNIGISRNHARRLDAGVSILAMTCSSSSCCQFAGSGITTALPLTLAFCSLKADLALTGESVITRRKSS